jgi:hypothetical protein
MFYNSKPYWVKTHSKEPKGVLDVKNCHKKLEICFWPFETMVIMAWAYSRLGSQKKGKGLHDFYKATSCKYHLLRTNLNEKIWIMQFKTIHVTMVIFHMCINIFFITQNTKNPKMSFNGQPNTFFGNIIFCTCDLHLKLNILNPLNFFFSLNG